MNKYKLSQKVSIERLLIATVHQVLKSKYIYLKKGGHYPVVWIAIQINIDHFILSI